MGDISLQQAKCFANWYSEQGEQDADVWFSESQLQVPLTKSVKVDKENNIVYIEVE